MLITCNNKGCLKQSDALLNTETNEVICQECGRPITNIAETMKRVLKGAGQIVRSAQKQAFMVFCKKCNANRVVVLDEKNEVICKTCKNPVNVSRTFRIAMESAGALQKLEENSNENE